MKAKRTITRRRKAQCKIAKKSYDEALEELFAGKSTNQRSGKQSRQTDALML